MRYWGQACEFSLAPAILLFAAFFFAPVALGAAGEEVRESFPAISDDTAFCTLLPGNSDRPNHPVNRVPVTLSLAFETSYRQNPSVVAALKNLDVARAQIRTAGARPNPQFAMQYGFGTPYTEIVSGNTQQVGANQLIEMGGKRAARLRYARANYTLADYQLADLRYDVRSAVRKGYAELAAAEGNIELIESQRVLVQKLCTLAAFRYKLGKSEELEVMQANLELDRFEALLNSALARLRNASIELNYLLGYSPERDLDVEDNGLFKLSLKRTELVPSPDEPLPPLSGLLGQALVERADLKSARQQVETTKQAISLAKSQAVPDVLLGAGYVFSTYKKSNRVRQQDGAYLNVNFDLPIFYRHQGEIQAAKASHKQAQDQASAMTSRVEVDVRAAYSRLAAARTNITHYRRDLIPLASNVVRKAQDSYERGRIDVGSAIVAQQQFQQTFATYFDTVVAYQDAWADLETAIGRKIEF